MPVFLYKAQNVQGNVFEGQIEAKNKEEAESLLKRKRLIVQSVKKKPTEINLKIGTGIGSADISRFTRMFSSMTSAGLPMMQCMSDIEVQLENPALKEEVHKLTRSSNGGTSVTDSLTRRPETSDKLYCNIVTVGSS